MDRQLAEAKNKPKKKRKLGKRIPLATWIRKRTSRLNYGDKGIDEDGKTRAYPELDTKKLITQYNQFRYGAALTNKQFQDHFDNLDTFYCWADHRTTTAVVLAMIDIDVHDGVGSKAGAWAFGELVRQIFPGMYLESSTGGNGVHGFLTVRKKDITANAVKWAFNNLQAYLRELQKYVGADISCVEVKGHPPLVKYDDNGNIVNITFGQFAKVPRGAGVVDTCEVDYQDLAFLDPADIPAKFKGLAAPQVSNAPCPVKASPAPMTKTYNGSFDPRLIRQNVLDQMPELERYASRLICQWTGKTSFKAGRWTVTAEDMAQFFVVMTSIKENFDFSLPVRRIEELWDAAHESDDFARAWNYHRFKAIRDKLSEHGHVEWINHFYFNYPVENDKRKRDGVACKWRLSDQLSGAIRNIIDGGATPVDTVVLPNGKNEHHVPQFSNKMLQEHEDRWLYQAEQQIDALFRQKYAA
jgi:hypothetical protein